MREQLLQGIFFIVRRYAWAVLLVSVILSASGLYYIRDLQMRSSFLDLLPQDDELLNRFKEKEEILQKADAVTIVVSCDNKIEIAPCQKSLVETADVMEQQLRTNPEITFVTYKKDPQSPEGANLLSDSDKIVLIINEQGRKLKELQARLGTKDLAQVGDKKLVEIYRQFNQSLDQFQFLTQNPASFPNPLDFFKLPSVMPLYEGIKRLKEINEATKKVLITLPETLDESQKSITTVLEALTQIEETLNRLLDFKQVINFSKDNRALRIDARPQFSSQKGLEYNRQIANFIRQTLESPEVNQTLATANLKVAYTGSYIIATDSNFAINADMLNTTIISAVGIIVVMLLTLRRWLYPLMAMVALFVALIWTFAWAKFSVGGLNLVTSFLPSLILGLGIDYGINFIAYFLDERRRGKKTSPALHRTMIHKGGAIVTAGLATTLVLFSLMVSGSPGLAEMGIIAGMGVFFSLVVTLFILPSLMLVTNLMSRRQLRQKTVKPESLGYGRLIKRSRFGIIVIVVVASLGLWWYLYKEGVGFRFVDDHLAPQNLPSQLVMREQVRNRFEVGPGAGEYFLFFTRDRVELQRVTEALQRIESGSREIDAVFSLALFLPPESANLEDLTRQFQLEESLSQARRDLNTLQDNLTDSSVLLDEVRFLSAQLSKLANLATLFGTNATFRNELIQLIEQLIDLECLLREPPKLLVTPVPENFEDYREQLDGNLTNLRAHLDQCPSEVIDIEAYTNKINKLRALMNQPGATVGLINNVPEYQDLLGLAEQMKKSALNPKALSETIILLNEQLGLLREKVEALLNSAVQLQELSTLLQKLPQDLRERFVTTNNEYVIYAHIRRDVLNDREKYQGLKAKIEAIEADVLGVPMIAEQLEKSMKKDFLNSTYFAVAIILVVMALGLRELFLGPLWGLVPVGLGFLWMLAGMRFLNIDFNFANIVISSILIGNGVDYAVYVLHSYMNTRSVEKAMSETVVPVLGSAVTTMISFGSLLFANTPGLQLFGISALLGVGFTTLFTLSFLPALLAFRRD